MSGIIQQATLRGVIRSEGKLSGAVQPEAVLKGSVALPQMAKAEIYDGAYEITPKVDAQVIPTAQKMMMDDLTVMAIPIYSVSNNAGGATFYIATGEPDSGVAYLGKSKLGEMIL